MGERKLHIYFTSDLHGYIFPTDYRSTEEKDIGLFKCANRYVKDGNTLIIDGGDLLQGSPLGAFCHDSLHEAESLADVMNMCGYDYVTLGNHDFNYGMDYLDSYLNNLNARCVCQNVRWEDSKVRFPARIHILENGLRIGILGIVTDHVNVWERKEHLNGVLVTEPLAAIRSALKEIKSKSDLTVCIYHGGFEQDLDTGKILSSSTENIAYKLCRELDIDIMLTGHQHMTVTGRSLFGTYVVQPTDFGREFIEIEAIVSDDGTKSFTGRHISAGAKCEQKLLDAFGHLEEGAQAWLDRKVGELDEALLPEDPLTMASEGNRLAEFFNKIQLEATGAQISAASLANEVAGLPGNVTRRDVLNAYPYSNTLVVVRVTGKILRQALERSAAYFDLDANGSLCISERFLKPKVEHYNYDYYAGIEYVYDIRRPVGNRVVSLTYQGRTISDGDSFSMCLNSYRASGTGGYDCYLGCPVEREYADEMSDLMLRFFAEHPKAEIRKTANFNVLR